jgi:hypothetical protein
MPLSFAREPMAPLSSPSIRMRSTTRARRGAGLSDGPPTRRSSRPSHVAHIYSPLGRLAA